MAGKKREFVIVNRNRNGEVFDPSTVTIRMGDVPGFDIAMRELLRKVGMTNE